MADQTGAARLAADSSAPADAVRSVPPAAEADIRSVLDQAAADGSITDARHRAVEPVPIVAADVTDGADLATLEAADGEPSAPIWRVRRKLSPRPVPGNRRRKPPVPAPATDDEPTPAEEMDDVGTQPDKAAKAADAEKAVTTDVGPEETPATDASTGSRGTTATATKPAKPKTAAEIVAEQRAREKAAAERPKDDTAVTKPVTRQPAAPSSPARSGATVPKATKPVAVKKTVASSSSSSDKGKAALSAVGSGVKRFRNLVASLVWLIAVIAAGLLALGALFTALDQANQSNEIVKWVLERGHDLVGPFKDLFRLETAKNTLLVNWGIAALVYLIIGKIAERFIRP
ncbi:hypothetical protein [Kribbella catacumbae]|uniref:hypothetical protein n=1 Tax=Kribbella catacumbae TaxID=460086 RepID=UPI00035E662B|nr:hypothetical protein [Kribbella catacumbae]